MHGSGITIASHGSTATSVGNISITHTGRQKLKKKYSDMGGTSEISSNMDEKKARRIGNL